MVRAMPGAADLLATLRHDGVRVAAVTNRSRQSSLASLDRVGLLRELATVVSSEDVLHQKPHPEPVWLALARLGVQAALAVMVGDTVADVEAGRSAGSRTIGIAAGFGGPALVAAAPDAFVPALADVWPVLARWRAEAPAANADPVTGAGPGGPG
jgi:beta-phosphoglucomutase-like phosphatase (HAD superfamily)